MNTHLYLILIAVAFVSAAHAFMLPEDKLTKKYWDSLDAKTKPIFLMGYRHGTGPEPGAPETKRGFLVLSAEHFPRVIEKLDAFYKDKDNEHVRIRLAIQIALMEMTSKPKAEIDALLKKAREEILTSF
jgi:hypothetical protein